MMDIKKLSLIFLIAMIHLSSCHLKDDPCEIPRKFTYDLTVFNLKDTFDIGEDIVFKLVVPDMVLEENTNELMDISEWNYFTDISLFKIYEDSLISAYPYFEYIDSVGVYAIQIFTTEVWRVATILERKEGQRVFVGKFRPMETGKYIFSITHLITDIVLPDCPLKFVNLHYDLNNGADNYYHLIESEEVRKEFTEEEMRQAWRICICGEGMRR